VRLVTDDVTPWLGLAPDVWLVRVDPGQIEQVLMNLAANARDAMPEGGRLGIETANVVVAQEDPVDRPGLRRGEYVLMTVSDTGQGMPEEVRTHIFEPFFTTKESGKGTGLGLATVYGIVTQSGGAIELLSVPGHGTTFSIHLPAASGMPGIESPSVEETAHDTGTVLLVEDEDPVRAILRKSLRAAGYEVLEARSGPEALALLEEHPAAIDVLLTDIVMPGMSGLALSEAVAMERPGTRVVFMSGHAADAIARHGFDPARARFLQKPFSTQALCRELRAVRAA
jgi:CheY-like chemotaxis protein